MKKIPNWEISFDAYINRNINTPFEWGKWDCVMFTNGFIKTMTKKDLLPNTWKWETEEQAMQSIFKYGKGKGLAAAIDNAIKKTTGMSLTKNNILKKIEELGIKLKNKKL